MISRFPLAEPSAAEGSLHGGAGRRFQETSSRLPFHRPAALHQAKETGCGVSLGGRPDGELGSRLVTRKIHWFKFLLDTESPSAHIDFKLVNLNRTVPL